MNYILCGECFFVKEEAVWFSSFFHNGLYRLDKASGRIEPVMKFPGEKEMAFRLFGNIVGNGKSIVFVPLSADSIAIYIPESHELKMLPLPEKAGKYRLDPDQSMKFWTSVAYGNRVFMFGWAYPVILELDMDTQTFHCHTKWADELDVNSLECEKGYFGAGYVQGKYAYLPLLCSNYLMRFNLETAEYKWMKVKTDAKGFAGVSLVGEDMWLVPCEYQDIIKWSPISGVEKILKIPGPEHNEIGIPFYAPLVGEKGIYLFPAGMEDVYFINPDKDMICRHERLSDILAAGGNPMGGGLETLSPMVTEAGLFFINGRDYSWHLYDEKTGNDQTFFPEADKKIKAYINRLFFDDMIEKRNCIKETKDFSLTVLLGCMKQGEHAI